MANAIHRINHDPWDSAIGFAMTYPLDSDLSGGSCLPNTEALKKSFRFRGAVTWNSLSAEAKQATTLKSFYSVYIRNNLIF